MALLTNPAGTNIADVDANSRLKVQPPTDGTNAGAMFLVGKSDLSSPSNTGSITGSSQGLLGVARATVDFDKNFANTTNVVTGDLYTISNVTNVLTANVYTLNSGAAVGSGSYTLNKTYRSFKIDRGADRVFGIRARLDQTPIPNTVVEIGAFLSVSTNAPTGGCFFRYGADGVLRGVSICVPGTEAVTSPITMSTPTDFHDYIIVVGRNSVTFFIDELPVASITIPADAPSIVASDSLPISWRLYYAASTVTAQKLYVARYLSATLGGVRTQSDAVIRALQGDAGLFLVGGTTGGGAQTTTWANSIAPAGASLSNTAAGYTTLGGLFSFTALAASEVDYALFAFSVPFGAVNSMGRTLLINGITIDGFVATAGGIQTVATVLQWGFAVGSTALSLATSDGAGAKSPRRGPLGVQAVPIGAVAGTELRRISTNFGQPLPVNGGEYFHIILRIPLGAATTYPTIRGGVYVDASWE